MLPLRLVVSRIDAPPVPASPLSAPGQSAQPLSRGRPAATAAAVVLQVQAAGARVRGEVSRGTAAGVTAATAGRRRRGRLALDYLVVRHDVRLLFVQVVLVVFAHHLLSHDYC